MGWLLSLWPPGLGVSMENMLPVASASGDRSGVADGVAGPRSSGTDSTVSRGVSLAGVSAGTFRSFPAGDCIAGCTFSLGA